jgi:hypothetical protein
MANVDKYLKTHEAIVNQAKALKGTKKRGKGTTPAANKYIGQQWALMGANAPASLREADPKDIDWDKVKEDRVKQKIARKKREMKQKNFVV